MNESQRVEKAVILAAGRGTRLAPLTSGLSKCLMPFGDKTILDHQIDSLFAAGVSEIAIAVGYRKEHIIEHVRRRYSDLIDRFEFLDNPDFATTNNMYSLWMTRDWLGDSDFMCLNADTLCHAEIVRAAAAAPDAVSVSIAREYRDETTKVITVNGHVERLHKSVTREQHNATFIGIATLAAAAARTVFARAEANFAAGRMQDAFNEVIDGLIADGLRVAYTESGDLAWAEVDDATDWEFAMTHVYPYLSSAVTAHAVTAG